MPRALDPSTGPIPRDKFREIVAAPFGEAANEIRKYDPLWGRAPGEKLKWKVTYEREVVETGTAIVEAETEKEAERLADGLDDSKIRWDYNREGDIISLHVEPLP